MHSFMGTFLFSFLCWLASNFFPIWICLCRTWMKRTRCCRGRRRWLWEREKEPGEVEVEEEAEEQEEQRTTCFSSRSTKFPRSSLTLWLRRCATAQPRTSSSRWGESWRRSLTGAVRRRVAKLVIHKLCLLPRLCPRPSTPTLSYPTPIRATTSWWRRWPRRSALRSPPQPSRCSGCCWTRSACFRLRAAGEAPGSSFLNSKSR